MLVGSGRLKGTCWRSICHQTSFRHLFSFEQTVIHSPQKQPFIQSGSTYSFSNLARIGSCSDKDASISTTDPHLKVTIRRKSNSQTSTKIKLRHQLSDYRDFFVAQFDVLKNEVHSCTKLLRLKSFSQILMTNKKTSEKKPKVIHLQRPLKAGDQTEEKISRPSVKTDTESEVPSNFTFWFIMGLNVVVFAFWQLAFSQAKQGKPNLFYLMFANFTSSLHNLWEGRWYTLFTACISHFDYAHIFVNMLTYFYFGRRILALVGGRSFLFFYFAAGFTASATSLALKYLGFGNQQKQIDTPSLGASGSTIALVTCFTCIRPREWFLFYFIIPVPAWILVPGLFMYDLWGIFGSDPNKAWWSKDTVIDSAGHIGGFIAGRLFWIYKLRRFRITW